MKALGWLLGLLALTAFIGCGNTDLNKDLKPVEPTAKPFTPQDGAPGNRPGANPGVEGPAKAQKVITQ